MNSSWKTTALGIGAILSAIGGFLSATFDGDPSTVGDMAVTIAAVSAGIGMIFAKDGDQ